MTDVVKVKLIDGTCNTDPVPSSQPTIVSPHFLQFQQELQHHILYSQQQFQHVSENLHLIKRDMRGAQDALDSLFRSINLLRDTSRQAGVSRFGQTIKLHQIEQRQDRWLLLMVMVLVLVFVMTMAMLLFFLRQ
jgi:hypothetical protein